MWVYSFTTIFLMTLICIISHQTDAGDLRSPLYQIEKMDDKFANLLSRFYKRSLILITKESSFNRFLVQQPRNYASFALFTKVSTQHQRCLNCEDARNILHKISQRHYIDGGFQRKPVFFFEIPIRKIEGLSARLGINSLPSVLYFPEEGRLQNVTRLEASEVAFRQEHRVIAYIEETAGITLNFHQTVDYSSMVMGSLLVLGLGVVMYKKWSFWRPVVQNMLDSVPHYSLVIIVLMISGHVYNYVAMPIPFGSDRNGMVFIAASRRYQFQVEAYIIAGIYFMFSIGFVLVIEARRELLEKNKNQGKYAAMALSGLCMTSVSQFLLTVVCQIKRS